MTHLTAMRDGVELSTCIKSREVVEDVRESFVDRRLCEFDFAHVKRPDASYRKISLPKVIIRNRAKSAITYRSGSVCARRWAFCVVCATRRCPTEKHLIRIKQL